LIKVTESDRPEIRISGWKLIKDFNPVLLFDPVIYGSFFSSCPCFSFVLYFSHNNSGGWTADRSLKKKQQRDNAKNG
jgi:hypothetical protein